MKPKRVLLARHGQSIGNTNKSIYESVPDYALPLTPQGCDEAADLGDRIKARIGGEKIFFYLSPWRRTRETWMHTVSKLERSQWGAIEDPRLREQEWGHLRSEDATKLVEAERDAYGTFYFRFGHGEAGTDVYDRQSAMLETAYRDFEKPSFPENACFIGHGFQLRILLARWLHWTPEQFETVANPHNCELWVMELQSDGHYKLVTPLRTHQVKHNNIAIPPGYEKLMPVRGIFQTS